MKKMTMKIKNILRWTRQIMEKYDILFMVPFHLNFPNNIQFYTTRCCNMYLHVKHLILKDIGNYRHMMIPLG